MTQQERLDRGFRMATIAAHLDALRDEKKSVMDSFREKEALLLADLRDVRDQVITGAEKREVDVTEEADLTTRTIVVRRADTLQIVDSRPMTESEVFSAQQPELPHVGARVETADTSATEEADPVTGELMEPKRRGRRGALVVDKSGAQE